MGLQPRIQFPSPPLKALQRNRYCSNLYCSNLYCSNPCCCNDYCCIVLAVSELAQFLRGTRTAVLLADDQRHCVDADPGVSVLGVSRDQLLASPIDDRLAADDRAHGQRSLGAVAPSQRDAAVRNQRLSPHNDRKVAA